MSVRALYIVGLGMAAAQSSAAYASPPIAVGGKASLRLGDAGSAAKLAKCVSKKRPSEARALIMSVPGSEDESSRLAAIMTTVTDCGRQTSTQLSASERAVLIAALAEPMVLSLGKFSAWREGPAPDLNMLARRIGRRTDGYPPRPALARCLTDIHPAEASAFVRSKPDSTLGRKALKTLTSSFSRCVDEGTEVSMNNSVFRAEMMRAFARHIFAPNDPVSVKQQEKP